jgi:cellulose synthase/poly-beta-1,6-N-acetylglucosamine synthase-like glycosyltransferase
MLLKIKKVGFRVGVKQGLFFLASSIRPNASCNGTRLSNSENADAPPVETTSEDASKTTLKYLLFLDGDSTLDARSLQLLKEEVDLGYAAASGALCCPADYAKRCNFFEYTVSSLYCMSSLNISARLFGRAHCVVGACFLADWKSLTSVLEDYLEPSIPNSVYPYNTHEIGEDMRLTVLFMVKGYYTIYVPSATAVWRNPSNVMELLRQRRRWHAAGICCFSEYYSPWRILKHISISEPRILVCFLFYYVELLGYTCTLSLMAVQVPPLVQALDALSEFDQDDDRMVLSAFATSIVTFESLLLMAICYLGRNSKLILPMMLYFIFIVHAFGVCMLCWLDEQIILVIIMSACGFLFYIPLALIAEFRNRYFLTWRALITLPLLCLIALATHIMCSFYTITLLGECSWGTRRQKSERRGSWLIALFVKM